MSVKVTCSCCGQAVRDRWDETGRRVLCPCSGRLVEGRVVKGAPRAERKPERRRKHGKRRIAAVVAGVAMAALLVGVTTFKLARGSRERAPLASTNPVEPAKSVARPSREPAPVAVAPAPRVVPETVAVAPLPREVLPVNVTAVAGDRPAKPMAEPALVEAVPAAVQAAAKPEPKSFGERQQVIYRVPVRIDKRSADQIERELLSVREIALDTQHQPRTSSAVLRESLGRANARQEPPSVMACYNRPDLAGLPFQLGSESMLSRDRAEAMNSLSRQFRETVASMVSTTDPRPDPGKLFNKLVTDSTKNSQVWARPDAVPCIQQMMQAEGAQVRRVGCELLRDMPVSSATESLVKWAVFDTDAENRAAAVDALRDRDRAEVSRLLTQWLRYPWPRAVEHACEAIIALDLKEAVPQLAAAYDLPDPDQPFRVDLPGSAGGSFRWEMVRVNHLRNCMLCHPPSFNDKELVRGSIPDPQSPLPPPTTPSYYTSGGSFVAAEVTYLRQDFSVVQPVMNHGPWPSRQRYDYMIAIKRDPGTRAAATEKSPYRHAIGLALRTIDGHNPEIDRVWMREQQAQAVPLPDARVSAAARLAVLSIKPAAYTGLKVHEFRVAPERMTGEALGQVATILEKQHGTAARLALIAHFDSLARGQDTEVAVRASRVVDTIRHHDGWLGNSLKKALEVD